MPSVRAATAPSTTAGKWMVAALRNTPRATRPPSVCSRLVWVASTEMPPLSTAGTTAVRRTSMPGT